MQVYKRIKTTVALLVCLCIVVSVPTTSVSAHTRKVDGDVSGVLHISPDDEPVSGSPSTYVLFLTDYTKRFSLSACNCRLLIKQNGNIIATQPLKANAQSIPGGSITFPAADVYELIFSGVPLKDGAFQPFVLHYTQRVTQGAAKPDSSPVIWIGLAVTVCLIALIASWLEVRSQLRYNKHNQREKT